MNIAENLKPFQRVLAWSQFDHARDNDPDRHNGTWDELAKLLTTVNNPSRKKDPSEAKKACPAFSGTAFFSGTLRGRENAEGIHLLIFDFDNTLEIPIPGEFHPSGRPKTQKIPIKNPAQPEDVVERLKALGYAAVVYTTWSSSPQLVKFRVVIPLQATISPAYWTQATEWAMEALEFHPWRDSQAIDIPVLRDTARLNFLPSAPDPSTVRVWELKGKHFTIPEAALPAYEIHELPKPAWQSPRPKKDVRSGRDWWTSYRIDFKTLNLEGLLKAMGVKVGKSQPWNNGFKHRCHCPWASEHTHGIDDDCAVIIATNGEWPSFKCQHSGHSLLGLREICETAGMPMVESYAARYTHVSQESDAEKSGSEESDGTPPAAGDDDRRPVIDRLHRNKDGVILKVPANLAKILRFDPQWGSRLSLNEMSQDICHDRESKTDHFIDEVQEWVQDTYHLNFGREETSAKIAAQAAANPIHPVKEMLLGLPPWDEKERIRKVGEKILGEPASLAFQYILRSMVGAVRRVFEPGTKMDTIPVLIGPQGGYKSTFWRYLYGPEWFSDSPIDLDSKDGMMNIHRRWCTELSEIDHMTSTKAAERIKAFISSSEDIFRPPFSRSVRVFPRSCVLVGTANQQGFLVDPTGSRRFWPILVQGDIQLDILEKWRDQLWAEALNAYHAGVEHWLPRAVETLREEDASRFEAEEPWSTEIDEVVGKLSIAGQSASDGYPISDLLIALGVPVVQRTRSAAMKLAGILKAKGWTKEQRMIDGNRNWRWYP